MELKKFLTDFFKNRLSKEGWYKKVSNKVFGVIAAGSHVRGTATPRSDYDITVFLPRELEGKVVKSGYSINYKNGEFDISIASIESLKKVAENKIIRPSIFWTWGENIILYEKDNFRSILKKATKWDNSTRKNILWSFYCMFRFYYDNDYNFSKDRLTYQLLIQFFVDCVFLAERKPIPRMKWKLKELEKLDKELYHLVMDALIGENMDRNLKNMKVLLDKKMIKNGFKEEELKKWREKPTVYWIEI